MKRLFGVTRDDLYQMSGKGTRKGNVTDAPYVVGPRGSAAAKNVMTKENEQRLLDVLAEAEKYPDVYGGMKAWYTMDPLYAEFKRLYGADAPEKYAKFNTLTSMASPGSDVLTELNRGTAANWLSEQGRFDDFLKYGGGMGGKRPEDMAAVMGHPYHKTAQGLPMKQYLDTGEIQMKSAKVPSYMGASGVPETGFQTMYAPGDAHFARGIGLPDVRTMPLESPAKKASATVAEMSSINPWFQEKIAKPAGLEPVPAQATLWGALSKATGVDTPIGAPKLELLAMQIMKTAERLGVSPETARDLVLTGKTHAGQVDPELLALMGAGGAATAAAPGVYSWWNSRDSAGAK